MSVTNKHVRRPAVAGLFYPADPAKLRDEVSGLLDNTTTQFSGGQPRGLIVPHAGYRYSGYVAAEAFATIRGMSYHTVIILSPSHHDYFHGISVIRESYRTPLGDVPVALEAVDRILDRCALCKINLLGHRDEHGIEVELPFLQVVLKNEFSIIPLVFGTQDNETIQALSEALTPFAGDPGVLLVASSDLSHFYNAVEAEKKDSIFLENATAMDDDALYTNIKTRKTEACGYGPVLAVMRAMKKNGITDSRILMYRHSGHVSGDFEEVVGYAAGLFYKH